MGLLVVIVFLMFLAAGYYFMAAHTLSQKGYEKDTLLSAISSAPALATGMVIWNASEEAVIETLLLVMAAVAFTMASIVWSDAILIRRLEEVSLTVKNKLLTSSCPANKLHRKKIAIPSLIINYGSRPLYQKPVCYGLAF